MRTLYVPNTPLDVDNRHTKHKVYLLLGGRSDFFCVYDIRKEVKEREIDK